MSYETATARVDRPAVPVVPGSAAEPNRDVVYVAGNLMGVLSIVIGGIATLVSFIPLIGIAAAGGGAVAAFWGLVGFLLLRLGRRGSAKLPLIGLCLGGAAIAISICMTVLMLVIGGSSAAAAE